MRDDYSLFLALLVCLLLMSLFAVVKVRLPLVRVGHLNNRKVGRKKEEGWKLCAKHFW
jgi:hypothetical protein